MEPEMIYQYVCGALIIIVSVVMFYIIFLWWGRPVSIDGQVDKWTARECETRRVGVTRPKKQNKVNANDNYYFEDMRLAA